MASVTHRAVEQGWPVSCDLPRLLLVTSVDPDWDSDFMAAIGDCVSTRILRADGDPWRLSPDRHQPVHLARSNEIQQAVAAADLLVTIVTPAWRGLFEVHTAMATAATIGRLSLNVVVRSDDEPDVAIATAAMAWLPSTIRASVQNVPEASVPIGIFVKKFASLLKR